MSEVNYVPDAVAKIHDAIQGGFDRVRNLTGRQITAITVAGGLALGACGGESISSDTTTPGSTPGTSEVAGTPEACADTWVIVQADSGPNNRYMAEGVQEIKDAQTPEEARNAANVWLTAVKADPELLAGASLGLLGVETTPAELQDAEGVCATPRAQEIATALDAVLTTSDISAGEIPAEVVNSGIDPATNEVVVADTAGISGDRKGLQITQLNGNTVYVLGRCGNLAFVSGTEPAAIPKGPTDNILFPPVVTTETTLADKYDDGKLPGDGTPASQDKGTPDKPGVGPAGQTPNEDGYLPTETRPSVPAPTETTVQVTSTNLPPATYGPTSSTTPPSTAKPSVTTSTIQTGPLPTEP